MRQYQCEIDGHTYEGETASAKEQFEALHIVLRTGVIATLQEDTSDMGLVASFAMLKFEDVQRLQKLLLDDKVKRDEIPIGQNLFRDNIEQLYLLLAYALRENLGGFWKLRRQKDEAAGQADS